jgi:hypothetical protein
MALSRMRWNDAPYRAPLRCRTSPPLSTTALQVCRMTRHLEHLHYPVAGNQQAIPASDLTSNYEITRPVGYLEFPAHRAEAILSDHSSEQRSQHPLNSPEVLSRPHSNYISLRRPRAFLQVAVSKAPISDLRAAIHQYLARALQIQPMYDSLSFCQGLEPRIGRTKIPGWSGWGQGRRSLAFILTLDPVPATATIDLGTKLRCFF